MKTKSGNHVIFHRSFCPFATLGKTIPADYIVAEYTNKPYFFIPKDGNPTAVGDMRGYPMIYSEGHASEDDALAAAELWEAVGQREADRQCAIAQAEFEDMMLPPRARCYEILF